MEEVISGIVEKTLVGGAFFYLLTAFVSKFSKSLENISGHMLRFGECLSRVSDTLLRIDSRVEKLEQRIQDLERRGV